MAFKHFNGFDHMDANQLKRLANMKKIKAEDVTIDRENETAVIVGSSGTYDVTLDSCICMDYLINGYICKHMYKLATELGYIEFPTINEKASQDFKETIPSEIDRYTKLYESGSMSLDMFIKIVSALSGK